MKRMLAGLFSGCFLALEAAASGSVPDGTPRVEHLQQMRLEVAQGQYSGITPVGENVYAVVHDKATGGGLFFFTLDFRADGSIAHAMAFELGADGPMGLDNEDVVYVPETRSLFISSESDQCIREYRLDGQPTGRELAVPQSLKTIQNNAGFEALAYRNGTFWTTTEAPIPGETLHRLQSFSLKNLKPQKQYLYQPDQPLIPQEQAKGALAYVYGISAMTVLEDGTLAVMEREVYVPSGGFFAMLASFSCTSIYLVDPPHDKGTVLHKTLLTRFLTGPLNLANFEGMCLGPKLEDGRQALLLIADSQDGAHGLTDEYIRVILYTPSAL